MASDAQHAGVSVSDETLAKFRELLSAHSEEIAAAYADAGYDEDKVDWKQIEDHLKESWQELAQGVVINNLPKALDPLNPTDEEREAIRSAMLIDNPYLVPWLEQHGAALVTEIVDETRKGLRDMLVDAHEQGDTVDEVRAKVKERVGLLDRDYAAVINYEQELIDDGMDEADAKDEAAIYADELLERRADNIARTEINFAESNGTLATWLTAADSGMTLPSTKKVWIAGSDKERTCPICGALDGTEVDIDGEWELPNGMAVPCPPAHPSCRCDMGMVTDLGKQADQQQEQAMPEGTGLTGAAAEQWQAVYDQCVKDGDDEETAAKKAWGAVKASGNAPEPTAKSFKSQMTCKLRKFDDEKQVVFGWLSVAKDENGNSIVDHQGHEIPIEVLEDAAYEFVLDFRKMGDCHDGVDGRGRLVESVVMTVEKQDAMGIPPGVVPEGWWVGFKVDDKRTWGKVKNGDYEMMSIGGEGIIEDGE